MNTISILRKTDKYKGKIMGFACSYSGAKILGIIDGATSTQGLLEKSKGLLNIHMPSNILMYVLILATIVIYFLNWVLKIIVKNQKPSEQMNELMKKYTADAISKLHEDESTQKAKPYSWGYNYCIFCAPNYTGWLPEDIVISSYDNKAYNFAGEIPYSKQEFKEYIDANVSNKVAVIETKKENRERFAVCHINPNFNKNQQIIELKLKKTSWLQLQFHWDYFRLLNNDNTPVENKDEKIVEKIINVYEGQGRDILLNSFCLHLIVETEKGVVLSRIGKGKTNDYPTTWAATIGEQIEEMDFYATNGKTTEIKKDFVECWVKRALQEEFGVGSEEEIFEMDSLRVLSIDMEADIYNIALTCVIKLKDDKSIRDLCVNMDQVENYELCEKNIDDICNILFGYPNNCTEYHPSTYLRLLMYYRYKNGIDAMNKTLVQKHKEYMKNKQRKK